MSPIREISVEIKMIRKINPVARSMLSLRKSSQVVKPKKGKGSYTRKGRRTGRG